MNPTVEGDAVSPADWYATMPAPALTSSPEGGGHVRIRRYTDTAAEMLQPPLTDTVLCLHLGGAKQVRRWRGGQMSVHHVELGALTIMPAGQSNRWMTEGPIDFAHLTLNSALLDQIAIEEFDREPTRCELIDAIGVRDPYIELAFRRLLLAIEGGGARGRLYPDSLLVVLTAALLGDHSAVAARPATSKAPRVMKGGLAAWRLRRVVDYMMAEVRNDIGLAELTAMAGLSRAQFFRAFKQSTGLSPHRYLARLRMDKARALFDDTDLNVAEIGDTVGLNDGPHFAALFKARFGVSPKLYRHSRS